MDVPHSFLDLKSLSTRPLMTMNEWACMHLYLCAFNAEVPHYGNICFWLFMVACMHSAPPCLSKLGTCQVCRQA